MTMLGHGSLAKYELKESYDDLTQLVVLGLRCAETELKRKQDYHERPHGC
jgi:hypothetical protein